ncbi:MAG: patatin-like phospholipase family protein [Bacteroidetes bacterium]|nr:patatin-like phospholipase family protein [Bacteroidota bacterium]
MTTEAVKKPKIGITLSGGGARGIAHIGVLKALLENDIVPQVISGTSAGSIVGTLYAAGMTTDEMTKFVRSASLWRAIFPSWPNKGFISLSYLRKHLKNHLPTNDFEDLKYPLYITLSRLSDGKAVIKNEGSLLDVITASCAIPLVFQPVSIDGDSYVDGGLLMNLPASVIRDKCDYLIGVNLIPFQEVEEKNIKSMRSILERCFDLTIINNSEQQREICDLLIEPKELPNYNIFQFQKVDELVELGYQAGLEAVKRLEVKSIDTIT